MAMFDRIVVDPDIVHGRPRIAGTRVRVTDVLEMLAGGATRSDIVEDFPYLSNEDIDACLAYAAWQADHAVLIG